MLSPLKFAWLFCFLSAAALAGSVRDQVNGLLQKKNYAELDRLYEEANGEQFVICHTPKLYHFFDAMAPRKGDAESRWHDRLGQLEAWNAADADSIAASLALASYYIEYGFHARGTGWAREVSQESWKLFGERLKKAEAILDAPGKGTGDALYGHYLRAWLNAPSGDTFDVTRKEVAWLNERSPRFTHAYELMANYLLPRWEGKPGELTRYAAMSADRLGGEEGDMLYADLLTYAASVDEDQFEDLHHPDADRLARGCEALIRQDRNWRGRYAYALAMLGNWAEVRKQILLIGPVVWNFDYYWNGKKSYEEILTKSGARNDIVAARLLEGSGRLAEAEAAYRAFDPDPATNRWLGGFYLRHGDEARFAASAGAPDLTIPADKISLDDAANRCVVFGALRDFKRGEPFARRFDQVRGHNFTGKTFFYEAALFTGDKAAAQKAREAIVDRKTNRKSYQLAQRMLADGADTDAFRPDDFDWNDLYSRQGAIIVALRLYELGKPSMARRLLQAAWDTSTYLPDSDHILSLIYNPPVAHDEPPPAS